MKNDPYYSSINVTINRSNKKRNRITITVSATNFDIERIAPIELLDIVWYSFDNWLEDNWS